MTKKSKIVIGCMSWGKWGKNLNIKQQAEMINFCVENNNYIFDHADIYGDYTTESDFGEALIESGLQRDKIQLISKCGIQLVGKSRNNKIKHYNYSKDYIIWSAEESLKNLKTDYLDTFLLHRPSPLMQPEVIAEAISYLQESGKIIEFGVSNFTPSQIDLISKDKKTSANQIEFSLTQHDAMYNGTLDHMQIKNIDTLCWSPLGNVFKEENQQTLRIKKVLATLSQKYNISEDTVLLSWILKHPAHVSPVIGTTNKERIMNANKALDLNLELEDWFTLLTECQGIEVA
jgi:predicted oxidoreductase